MCLAHGEAHMSTTATGRLVCGECSRLKKRARRLRQRNLGTDRHPREQVSFVANGPLRAYFEKLVASGATTPAEIARNAGYVVKHAGRHRGDADTQRLQRDLGVTRYSSKKRDPLTGKRDTEVASVIGYDRAVRLSRAMGIEYPSEVGI